MPWFPSRPSKINDKPIDKKIPEKISWKEILLINNIKLTNKDWYEFIDLYGYYYNYKIDGYEHLLEVLEWAKPKSLIIINEKKEQRSKL